MLRSVIAAAIATIVAIPALAQEGADVKRFSVGAEVGYVFLAKPDNELLEDGMGFGGFVGYRLTPSAQILLPFIYSSHDGKDLPSGIQTELTIMNITPGVSFNSTGKLRGFMFLGVGASYVKAKQTWGLYEASDSEIGVGTKLAGGFNFMITDAMSVGVNGAVHTSTIEAERLNRSSEWETTPFYSAMGQFAYSF